MLCCLLTLLGRKTEQPNRFAHILGDSFAFVKAVSEIELGIDISLSGGLLEPLHCLGLIFNQDFSVIVQTADEVLGPGIALRGRLADPFHALGMIDRQIRVGIMKKIQEAEVELRLGITFLGPWTNELSQIFSVCSPETIERGFIGLRKTVRCIWAKGK